MDEEIQQPEPKISDVEIILIGLFYLIIDLIDLIPIAGDITDIIVAPMGFYYWMKGLNGTTFIVSEIIELIPLLQEIPTRVIGWGITVYIDRHPKLEAAIGTATKVAEALEGNVEGAEAESAAAGKVGSTSQAAKTTEPGTIDMTETRPGELSHPSQTEGVAPTEESPRGKPSEESAGQGNARPSETSTERGGGQSVEAGDDSQSPEGANRPTEEERRKQAADARYGEITTPEAEKNPIDVAKQKELGDEVPIRKSETPKNEPQEADPRESESTRYLRERFAREQAKQQKAREIREDFEKPKQLQNVTSINERQNKEEDGNALGKAA